MAERARSESEAPKAAPAPKEAAKPAPEVESVEPDVQVVSLIDGENVAAFVPSLDVLSGEKHASSLDFTDEYGRVKLGSAPVSVPAVVARELIHAEFAKAAD